MVTLQGRLIYLQIKTLVDTQVWRRQWHPTPVLLPGKSHGWRSLVGCSPWGRWESDMTEWLHFHFSLSCIGEGNGNPLQCSCLENPRDSGAWWAAVYGVTQNRTRLKWLNSSCSSRYPCGDLGVGRARFKCSFHRSCVPCVPPKARVPLKAAFFYSDFL